MRIITILALLVGFSIIGCQEPREAKVQIIEGETMGTYYRLSIVQGNVDQREVDSILVEVNLALSTYIPNSAIALFNKAEDSLILDPVYAKYFVDNIRMTNQIHKISNGAFDPTVMPLVNAWGFGYKTKPDTLPDSLQIQAIKEYVGWDKISIMTIDGQSVLYKSHPFCELDFSAIAKGYAVDLVSDYVLEKGYKNHLVEIGGEVRAHGRPNPERPWAIGISKPVEGASPRDFEGIVAINEQALATSGNYRNYREVEGVKVSHSIQPSTGYPERNSLLSATILAPTCIQADALATASMVLGLEKSKSMISTLPEVEALLIFGKKDGSFETWQTAGFPFKQ